MRNGLKHTTERTAEGKIELMSAHETAPCALYEGQVMHARLKPVGHRFQYRVFCLAVDLDRLAQAERMSPLFSVDRFNLVSFHQGDHHVLETGRTRAKKREASSRSLRTRVDDALARAGARPAARVVLLCYPRVLGFVFNPLSVYFCTDESGVLSAVIYEVRNTFGEVNPYVLPVRPGDISPSGLRQEQDKSFFVSPFLDMAQRYFFRLRPPGAQVRVRILERDPGGPVLAATFAGDRRQLTSATLLKAFARVPFLTFKIVAAIHFEAFRLWRKRVPTFLRQHRRLQAVGEKSPTTCEPPTACSRYSDIAALSMETRK